MKSLSIFPGLILLSILNTLSAQETKPYWLGVRAARSFATSGDIYGGFGSIFLEKPTRKNGSLSLILGGNMHTSEYPLFYPNPRDPNDIIDGSWRYLSAGVQIAGLAGKKLAFSDKHSFHFQLGPLLRYQNMSTDGFLALFPPITQLPVPVYVIDNDIKRQSFSFGGLGQIEYRWQVSQGFMLGIHSSAQFDTYGDFFYNYGVTVGTTFFKQKK